MHEGNTGTTPTRARRAARRRGWETGKRREGAWTRMFGSSHGRTGSQRRQQFREAGIPRGMAFRWPQKQNENHVMAYRTNRNDACFAAKQVMATEPTRYLRRA